MESGVEYFSSIFFGFLCHQDPTSLLEINGKSLMLCPRCCGLQIGFFVTLIFFSFKSGLSKLQGTGSRFLAVSGIILLSAEWILAQLQFIHSTSYSRLITGLLAGTSACIFLITYFRSFIKNSKHDQRISYKIVLTAYSISLLTGFAIINSNSWMLITILLIGIVTGNLIVFINTLLYRIVILKKQKIINT